MMDAASTSEASVNYQTKGCNNPEDSHLSNEKVSKNSKWTVTKLLRT
jgi:hypothetical protein